MMGSKSGIVKELHKGARRNFPRRYVTIKGLSDLYQADIVEMLPYSRLNKGYNYILTMIDAFSKKGWAVPLKHKTGKDVAQALLDIFSDLKTPPKFLQTDLGGEFYNKDVSPVLKKFGIKHYSTFSTLKASIAERYNCTIKNWIWREFSLRGNYRWIEFLSDIIKYYNNRVHRSTGFAPSKINKKNANIVMSRLLVKNLPPRKRNKFKIGNPVRISKYKHLFAKGYTPNWTTEVFYITKVQKTRPTTYKIKDESGQEIEGGFYEAELQKTKYKNTFLVEKIIRRKNDQVLVKWLGFDKKFNQWIPAEDVED